MHLFVKLFFIGSVLSACGSGTEERNEKMNSNACSPIDPVHLRGNSLKLTSGGALLLCDDGTLIASGATRLGEEWWRLNTTHVMKDPLVKACIVPQQLSNRQIEPWHNVLGIMAPYASDELNYAISVRRDGNLVVKKEVTDYTTLSPYIRVADRIPLDTPLAMTVSVVHAPNGNATIRAWVRVGDCTVDTSRTPQVIAQDALSPAIPEGVIELRTDFLSHHVLKLSACESAQNGTVCAGRETQFVPLQQ